MDTSLIKEEYVVKNLYREAKIMSRLMHPCIAALYQTMQVKIGYRIDLYLNDKVPFLLSLFLSLSIYIYLSYPSSLSSNRCVVSETGDVFLLKFK